MIAYRYRFHGHNSLRYLYRNGATARNRAVLLRYVDNPQRVHSRLAVVVGKKVSKSAVKRNRIRRRIYEVFRRHWDHIAPHTDMSVTVFSVDIATIPSTELEDMLLDVLHQARLYRSGGDSGIVEGIQER